MQKIFSKLLGPVGIFAQCVCIGHCTFEYVADLVLCSGPSMEPTIFSEDILITERISCLTQNIKRGDIVIAKCPNNPNQQICKRVVAMGGDKVNTGYLTSQIIPIGHVWLEGDNKYNSSDSRNYGPVPQGLIRSRAIWKVYPFKDMGFLRN